MIVIDAVARLLPGVIDPASLDEESHTSGLLEGPQYTRPPEFENRKVPAVLVSGDHASIAKWRPAEAVPRTAQRRPELPGRAHLAPPEPAPLPPPAAQAPDRDPEPLADDPPGGGPSPLPPR